MPKIFKQPSEELMALAAKAGGKNATQAEMVLAQEGIATAVQMNIREGIFNGDVVSDYYTVVPLGPNQNPEFHLSSIAPGEENDFTAFAISAYGAIPSMLIQSDYIMVPTTRVGVSTQALLQHIAESRADEISNLQTAIQMGFTKKFNDMGWQVMLAAGFDRDILAIDADAAAGQFTKRLISAMKTVMARNGGGNSASPMKTRLTDIVCSPEGIEDVRNWSIDQLDDTSRREVYVAGDGSGPLTRIMGVNLREMYEFGEGQQYQEYYLNQLGGSLGPNSDAELVVGLDLQGDNTFVMPVKEMPTVYNDATAHKEQLYRLYGWANVGFACLDSRKVILGSF